MEEQSMSNIIIGVVQRRFEKKWPHLATSVYFVFPNIKNSLGGKTFVINDNIISQTNTDLEDPDISYYLGILKKFGKPVLNLIHIVATDTDSYNFFK